ncbi:MAG: hypothetical protein AAB692_05575, partial [Patescibacteria group bacterium]
ALQARHDQLPQARFERPQFEEPGQVPAEVKGRVPESDLVAVYCASAKWKSGRFFAAMDAIDSQVVPAMRKITDLGIALDMPDPNTFRAEGQRRLDAICAAKDSDEADRLVRAFMKWGQTDAFDKYAEWRSQLRSNIEDFAARMRADVRAQLDPFVEEQKANITAEIQAKAQELAAAKSESLKSSQRPPTDAEITALKAEITSQLQGLINTRKADVAAAVQAKVKEIMGDKAKNLEDATAGFKDMEQKVNAATAAGAANYDKYKEDADGLRKKMVLNVLDSSMANGLKELDAHAAEIDEARKENPDMPSVAGVKAKLAADRKALEGQLDAALRSGDEKAFQLALTDFRMRWESYRTEMEKAAQQSIAKICTLALAQFDKGRRQMAPGKARIKELLDRCATNTSDECLRVNEFSGRLGTLAGKLDDLALEMGAIEKMCQTPETANRQNFMALLKKLQTDGEAVKTFGEALDAEKNKALAAGAKEMCDRALPQLKGAEVEISGNDMSQLKNKLGACKGKTTEECKAVLKLAPSYDKLAARLKKFLDQVATFRALCAGDKLPDIERLSVVLEGLKTEGEAVRADVKDLKAEVAAKASAKALCAAIGPQLDAARQGAAQGLGQMAAEQDSCVGKADERCRVMATFASKLAALKQRIDAVGSKIKSVRDYCASAPADKAPEASILADLEQLRAEGDGIPAAIAALKAEIDKAAAEAQARGKAQLWIEAEAEVRTSLLPRTEQWHSIKGKSSDSWRPPTFGSGYWYLSRGGEWLEYDLTLPGAGNYNFWIRDLASNVPGQEGQGIVTVAFDGKPLGSFAENEKGRSVPYPKGAFNWHKVASVKLSAGKHVLRITKQSTSSRAAILDAYYLTSGDEAPAQK